eukprot:3376860-Pleurochrysis_carterae.AAC.1
MHALVQTARGPEGVSRSFAVGYVRKRMQRYARRTNMYTCAFVSFQRAHARKHAVTRRHFALSRVCTLTQRSRIHADKLAHRLAHVSLR